MAVFVSNPWIFFEPAFARPVKADWEIGAVMKISEHGADKHMRAARVKLGAINRTQAVAEAIRRGLIA